MTSRSLLSSLILVLLLLPKGLEAQNKNQINWWRGSWKEAQVEARERNLPIIIAVLQDDEESTEQMIDDLFQDKKLVACFNEAIPIVCSQNDHGGIQIEKGAGKIEVCKRYGGTTCSQHMDHEHAMFKHFFAEEEAKTPQVMACRPDLGLIDRIIDLDSSGAFIKMVEKAAKKIGPGLNDKLYKESREMITRGRNHLRAKEYREAFDAVAELVALGGPATAVQRALEIQKSIDSALNKELELAYKKSDEGEVLAALIILDDLETLFEGTEPAKKAKAAFDRIKKSKEGRAAARDLSRDKRLRPDLKKGSDYEAKGEWEKAYDLYTRIVEKGEGLPSAARAQARLDYFLSDADIKRLLGDAIREDQAAALYDQAKDLKKAGKMGEAQELFQRIIKDFEGTKAAEKAKTEL